MTVARSCFRQWMGPSLPEGEGGLSTLKQRLAARGVNARGWRLYLDYGDALLEPLDEIWFSPVHPHTNVLNAVDYLKLLQACEMDVPPPLALARSLWQWDIPDLRLSLVPPLFFRAAWKATAAAEYLGEGDEAYVDGRILPVARWFFRSGFFENADPNLLKAGWSSLERRRAEWLATQRRLGLRDWDLPVRWLEWDAYRFVGLATEADLEEEGAAMSHCVGGYGDNCRETTIRVYSVRSRRSGNRVATLSVAMGRDGTWGVDQLNGPRNADVEAMVWRAVPALLSTLEQSCRAGTAEWLARFSDLAF